MARVPTTNSGTNNNSVLRPRSIVPAIITEEYLAALTRRLKLCIHRRARFLSEWEKLVQSAADAQLILDSKSSQRLTFTTHFASAPSLTSKLSILNPYTRHIVHFYLLPWLRIAVAIFLSAASIMIVWTELMYSIFPRLAVIRYTVVHHPSSSSGMIGFAGQFISAAWIAYMCFSAYYSLSVVKAWGNYALVYRGTSASSACFYSSYAARLTVPLAYNFVSFLPEEDVVKSSVFYGFMGRLINLSAISERFNDFFPVLVLIPVLVTLFNVVGRTKRALGFETEEEESDDEENVFEAAGWREGRDLIERELLAAGAADVFATRPGGSYGAAARRPVQQQQQRASRYRDEPEEEEDGGEGDEGPWGVFVHRVRNTFETVEAPRWWKDATRREEGRPRWMAGDVGGRGAGRR